MTTEEKPKYGKVNDRWLLDDHGSTLTESTNYRSGVESYPKRRDFEYRHPCDKTDLATITDIVQNLVADDSKLDAAIRFETRMSNGKKRHYVVECYTKLVY